MCCYSAFPTGPKETLKTYGLVEFISQAKVYDNPRSPTGESYHVISKVVQETDIVPLNRNVDFGIDVELSGFRPNSRVKLLLRIDHPRIETPDGKTFDFSLSEFEVDADARGNASTVVGFLLSSDYLLVPGTWTIGLWHDNIMLVEKSFGLVPEPTD